MGREDVDALILKRKSVFNFLALVQTVGDSGVGPPAPRPKPVRASDPEAEPAGFTGAGDLVCRRRGPGCELAAGACPGPDRCPQIPALGRRLGPLPSSPHRPAL